MVPVESLMSSEH